MTEAEKKMLITDMLHLIVMHDKVEWEYFMQMYKYPTQLGLERYIRQDPATYRLYAMWTVIQLLQDYLPGIGIYDLWKKANDIHAKHRKELLLTPKEELKSFIAKLVEEG